MESVPFGTSANGEISQGQQAGDPAPSPPTPPASGQQPQQPHAGGGPRPTILEMYSDGSLVRGRYAGAGVAHQDPTTGLWHGKAISLGVLVHIQDAEMYGFSEALRWADTLITQQPDLNEVNCITVYTDNQDVEREYGVRSLISTYRRSSGRWMACEEIDRKIADFTQRRITVAAAKVGGHTGDPGNDQADKMAFYAANKALLARDFDQVRRFDEPTAQEELNVRTAAAMLT